MSGFPNHALCGGHGSRWRPAGEKGRPWLLLARAKPRVAAIPPGQLRSQMVVAAWCRGLLGLMTALVCCGGAGCSSAITLREALRGSMEQAAAMTQLTTLGDWADGTPHAADPQPAAASTSVTADPATADYAVADAQAVGAMSLAEAIELAVGRLHEVGGLDAASKAALVATLEGTPPADWPVVVDEFAGVLSASREAMAENSQSATTPTSSALNESAAVPVVSVEASVVAEVVTPSAGIERVAAEENDIGPEATADQGRPSDQTAGEPRSSEPVIRQPLLLPVTIPDLAKNEEPQPIDPATAEPPAGVAFAARQLLLARKVSGWGQVEPIDAEHLTAGQRVIVYFELLGLEARESPAGFTTHVDTAIRLVSDRGETLQQWRFDPLEETCPSRRQDYFARYLLTLPEDLAAGDYQLALTITDRVSGGITQGGIRLGIVPAH
jgi:hypothetical protein